MAENKLIIEFDDRTPPDPGGRAGASTSDSNSGGGSSTAGQSRKSYQGQQGDFVGPPSHPPIPDFMKQGDPGRGRKYGFPLPPQWDYAPDVKLELGKAFKPKGGNPIEERIDEIFGRFSRGLLNADETMKRLQKTIAGDGVTDYFRDKYGMGVDPEKMMWDRVNKVAGRQGKRVPGLGMKGPGLGMKGPGGIEGDINEIFGKYASKKSNYEEAESDLQRLLGSGKGRDWFRDKHGADANVDDVFKKRFEKVAKYNEIGGKKYAFDDLSMIVPGLKELLPKNMREMGGKDINGMMGGLNSLFAGGGSAGSIMGGGLKIAGAGFLGKEMAALAGGPAGAAIAAGAAVVDLATDKVAGAFDKVRARIDGLGQAAVKVAGNDGFGLLKGAVSGYADMLEELPVQGKVLAAIVRAEFAVVDAFKMASDAFIARGKELQGYNGSLAMANAVADVRKLQADINEAERIGPAIARLTDAQSRTEVAFQEAIMPIKELMADGLAQGQEIIAKVAEFGASMEPLIKFSLQGTRVMMAFEGGRIGTLIDMHMAWLEFMMKISPGMSKFLDDSNKDDIDANEVMQSVFGLADPPMRPWQNGPDPAANAAMQRLGIPLLGQ